MIKIGFRRIFVLKAISLQKLNIQSLKKLKMGMPFAKMPIYPYLIQWIKYGYIGIFANGISIRLLL